jgi:hypothetical protein
VRTEKAICGLAFADAKMRVRKFDFLLSKLLSLPWLSSRHSPVTVILSQLSSRDRPVLTPRPSQACHVCLCLLVRHVWPATAVMVVLPRCPTVRILAVVVALLETAIMAVLPRCPILYWLSCRGSAKTAVMAVLQRCPMLAVMSWLC